MDKIAQKPGSKPPDSLRREASQAAGAAPTLRYGPAGDSATRLRLRRLVWPKGSFRPVHTARMPWFGVRCYRTISNEIQNHWLISASPRFPHKQSSLRIGPEQSRARSGEAYP